MQITIIGAGVSGLTTGIILLAAGHEVVILSAKMPAQSTSAKAAAIWFPYEVKPRAKANAWSLYSFHQFEALYKEANSGVSKTRLSVLIEKEEDAWWKDALPAGSLRTAKAEECPAGYPRAYVAEVPLVETQLYLQYLLQRFRKAGGLVHIKEVTELSSLLTSNDYVVNCTGLGAKKLIGDESLYPIQGQIVKAEPEPNFDAVIADFAFDEKQQALAYIVARRDCLVLGGTNVKNASSTLPNPQITEEIIARCRQLAPQLGDIRIQSVEVGLRPGRPTIRLEKEGRIIHNYGHGGGGFTVSWGCAKEVLTLL